MDFAVLLNFTKDESQSEINYRLNDIFKSADYSQLLRVCGKEHLSPRTLLSLRSPKALSGKNSFPSSVGGNGNRIFLGGEISLAACLLANLTFISDIFSPLATLDGAAARWIPRFIKVNKICSFTRNEILGGGVVERDKNVLS